MTTEYRFDQIAIVSTEKKKPTDADKDNYIGLEHLSPDTFDVMSYGADVAPKGEKLVMRKGDVLFGKRRAYQKKVGIAPCDGIFSAHGMVLRPNEKVVDARFFPFFIKSDAFLDEAIRISVGSLSPTVNWRDLRELRFNLPPMERQRELAGLLWAGENLRSTYRRLLDACDEQVKSRFIEMFGDLRGNKYCFPIETMENVTTGITDGEHGKVERAKDGPLFLSARNISSGVLDYETAAHVTQSEFERISKRFSPKPGDIVLTCAGTIGRAAIVGDVSFISDRDVALIKPDLDKVSSEYLLAFLYSDDALEQMGQLTHAATIAHLYLGKIKSMQLLVPPMEQQQEFADFVAQVDKSEYLWLAIPASTDR